MFKIFKTVAPIMPAVAFCICVSPPLIRAHHHHSGGQGDSPSELEALAHHHHDTAKPSSNRQRNQGKSPPAQVKQPAEVQTAPAASPVSATPTAQHKSAAADRQAVEVTIYNSELGLVKERRNIKLPAVEVGELLFIDVPSQINPVTVHIKPLANAADFAVLEQNYEFDLISHAKLMDKYIGKKIKIIESNDYQDRKTVVEAELMSAANGEVYKIGKEIYLGHPGIKILPELPNNLISRPTLSWIYRSKAAREYPLEVSYLTGGMSWNADYILSVSDGQAGAGLSGWVTVNNQSGAAYDNAKLKLVAGDVNRVHAVNLRRRGMAMEDAAMHAPMPAGYGGFAQSEVFEYHIYDLQRPTNIKDNQTKQISLLEAHGVTVVKEYITSPAYINHYNPTPMPGPTKQPVTAFLMFKNTKENQLGNPLPAGIIRIYTADNQGRQQFIGEDRIAHTPKDEDIRLKAGNVFDIVAERTQTNFKQITSKMFETEWMIAIRNRKEEDVTVKILESAQGHGSWEITESSHKHIKVDANNFRFDVPVGGKGKEVIVKYKIQVGI